MVLVGPLGIDITVAHRAISTSCAERAEVDVAEEHAHHQHGGHRVNHVRDVHVAALILQARYQLVEDQTGTDRGGAEQEHTGPEDDLLAAVEAVRWRLLAAEHAASPAQP